ncbi:uncharacterized protein TNCV_4450881 [Trichonephila clavipes]|nr:uncharacterized protein TNCV_4450881 [Trichonephila clavipes]
MGNKLTIEVTGQSSIDYHNREDDVKNSPKTTSNFGYSHGIVGVKRADSRPPFHNFLQRTKASQSLQAMVACDQGNVLALPWCREFELGIAEEKFIPSALQRGRCMENRSRLKRVPLVWYTTTRGLLATDYVILNHGQVTWTTPELAPPLLTTTPHQREDVSAVDRFNVHRCPTRRVFSGSGLELDKASHGPIPIPLGYRGH